MALIQLSVNGLEPAPQGSKRYVGNGRMIEASKRVKPWRKAVSDSASQQMRDQKVSKVECGCSVSIVFRFKRPKSHFTTNGQLKANAPEHCIVKRNDIDKCVRSTLDGLVDGGAMADDCLVIMVNAEKRYCIGFEPPGALISIVEIK